jgi:hypothetical protein
MMDYTVDYANLQIVDSMYVLQIEITAPVYTPNP